MLRRTLRDATSWPSRSICLFCAVRGQRQPSHVRAFNATRPLLKRQKVRAAKTPGKDGELVTVISKVRSGPEEGYQPEVVDEEQPPKKTIARRVKNRENNPLETPKTRKVKSSETPKTRKVKSSETPKTRKESPLVTPKAERKSALETSKQDAEEYAPRSLKDALLGSAGPRKASRRIKKDTEEEYQVQIAPQLQIQMLYPQDLEFEPVPVEIPPVPMLSYGLDRVLFNPGVYRLQDPRSRVYNFDPYLEKILPVSDFDFDALSEYKTSSRDEALIDLTKRLGTKFTGSTSSMSSVLQHFHYLLSNFRHLNHIMLSRAFPTGLNNFSKITLGPDAVFLRYKDGIYAIDADKNYDSPNIMSWLGHSLEKLLTVDKSEFELYRRSTPERAPAEDNSSRCYHYSRQGNVMMRSQLDAYDPRLPGTGIFDLKTRAVVSIRMNHKEYEAGSGYQLRYAQGEWESFEREFYDMTRATLLKYSLQVRMGRMDGIFLAYHNIERIFGFQYLSLPDMDHVLHGQTDTTLGDQEFKLSIALVDELLCKATAMFPETSLRLHIETRNVETPFMYVFAEPVTEEQADEIQNIGNEAQKNFARTVIGIGKDDPQVQAAWQDIQGEVDEQVDEDGEGTSTTETADDRSPVEIDVDADTVENAVEDTAPEGNAVEETTLEENGVEDTAVGEIALEADSQEPTKALEDVTAESDVEGDGEQSNEAPPVAATATEAPSDGPLMGWTLTVRSKVNGGYVDRPRDFTAEDDWQVEYHIQEIPEASRWKLYNALKDRRRALIGLREQEVDQSLQNYRDLIQRYSNRGREWRTQQDKLNEELGTQLYKPLGPGSGAPVSDIATEAPAQSDESAA